MSNGRHTTGEDLDTLREVANVAAAHAATALSQLTDHTIGITVPDLLLMPLTKVPDRLVRYERDIASVEMRILGELGGRILYLMPRTDARALAEVLLGRASLEDAPDEGLVESCLQETANILAGAYTGALSRMTGHDLMLSVPRFAVGDLVTLLVDATELGGGVGDFAFCVGTKFQLGEIRTALEGRLLLVSDPDSLMAVVEAARTMVSRNLTPTL